MLSHLYINNIALIDELNLDFCAGLNVLSGETGAGKSIIVDSLNLVLGERADRELIKSGEDRAKVEATFNIENHVSIGRVLDKHSIEFMGDELVLSRELGVNGKNICRANGSLINLSTLKEISDLLVDIHGQHEHQTLLHSKNHMAFLDRYGAPKIMPNLKKVKTLYNDYASIKKSIGLLCGDEKERERNLELLRFQIDEIENAKLKDGEEEELIAEKKRLYSAEKIVEALNTSYDGLFEGQGGSFAILDRFKDIINVFGTITDIDPKYAEIHERLNEAYYIAEETGMDIRTQKDEFFYDPESLLEIESRLNEINNLKRKYGKDIVEIHEYLARSEKEYNRLVNAEEQLGDLTNKLKTITDQLFSASMDLSYERKMAAKIFERAILKELEDLGMNGAGFEVYFSKIEEKQDSEFTAKGLDTIEFYITLNPGQPLKPLSKVASGGEISRIMLSFKNILGKSDVIQTNVFDEIDSGISGKIANVVADKLSSIARQRQVICVTHLAQIAAHANLNFLIEKEVKNGNTVTKTYPLDMEGRVAEIARLAGGIDSELSMQHAREMIEKAKN